MTGAKIRPHDLVRLRHTPEWTARVMVIDDDIELALIEDWGSGNSDCITWVRLDLLELVPGQVERMAA